MEEAIFKNVLYFNVLNILNEQYPQELEEKNKKVATEIVVAAGSLISNDRIEQEYIAENTKEEAKKVSKIFTRVG
jgi:hypothetical protein